MPRIRTIKPDFWTDEKIMELSLPARLFFIGLWNFSDDNGVLENKPKQIKARIFPGDDLDILPLIAELVDLGLLMSYEVDGQPYLICKNLCKHQYIDSPRKSNLPTPLHSEITGNNKKSQEILSGREGKGREKEKEGKRKGREGKGSPPPDGGPQPVFSCDCFDVDPAHLADLVQRHPEFPRDYLLTEFFPTMADWCIDHRNDPAHRKKFDDAGRLREPRRCLANWLKKEDPDRAVPYRRPKLPPPLPPDPPGMQMVWNPKCPTCRGGGRDRDGPCNCGHLEPIVDPDPKCPDCKGTGFAKNGLCTCFKPRGRSSDNPKETAAAAPI